MLTIKDNGSNTKKGPGRLHLQGRADGKTRYVTKLGRHLLKARHVLADFMCKKSPVGSAKGGK